VAFNNALDIQIYNYVGVSLSKSSSNTTNVCVYISTSTGTSGCQIFSGLYQTSYSNDGLQYRMAYLGQGLIGVLRTAYIWNYPKAPGKIIKL